MFNMKLLFRKWLNTAEITQNEFTLSWNPHLLKLFFFSEARKARKFQISPHAAPVSLMPTYYYWEVYRERLFAKIIFGTHFKTFKISPAAPVCWHPVVATLWTARGEMSISVHWGFVNNQQCSEQEEIISENSKISNYAAGCYFLTESFKIINTMVVKISCCFVEVVLTGNRGICGIKYSFWQECCEKSETENI